MPNRQGYNMVQVPGGHPSGQYGAPSMRLGRSQFNLSHNHKTTFDVGQVIPYFVTEVVPGDTMTCKLMSFIRVFSPLDAPIMDNIEASIEWFFVPNRIIWENWERFLGAHDDAGAQDTDYTIPVIETGLTVAEGDLINYMGVPIGAQSANIDINALPVRAYRRIINEWYRDQNLIDKIAENTGDSGDTSTQASGLWTSAKKHDYFTSALPYLQKGEVQYVPLTGEIDIRSDASAGSGNALSLLQGATTTRRTLEADSVGSQIIMTSGSTGIENNALYADLADITTGFSINALREAAAIQRLLERDARGGTRHPELIKAHFGVDVPDYRTQRPEYLGGGRGFINVSPVAQTSTEGGTENVGTLTGIGTGTLRSSWAKSFVEHGYVLGLLRARGEVSYQQGLDRMWSRETRYDFLWPEFAHLGEQSILNKEIFVSNSPATDDAVFGYQERFADYRFKKSLVTGKFASDATGSLDFWHLSEDFASLPALNGTFINDATPMDRVVAVPDEPHFIIDGRFDFRVARALPVRPVPTLGPARF